MAISPVLLILVSMVSGAVVGAFYGFCAAGHQSATSGAPIATSSRLIRLLTTQNASLSFGEALLMLLFLGLSLCLFFGSFMVPGLAAGWLGLDGPVVLISYAALFAAAFAGWQFGARLWRVVV